MSLPKTTPLSTVLDPPLRIWLSGSKRTEYRYSNRWYKTGVSLITSRAASVARNTPISAIIHKSVGEELLCFADRSSTDRSTVRYCHHHYQPSPIPAGWYSGCVICLDDNCNEPQFADYFIFRFRFLKNYTWILGKRFIQ